MQGNDDGERFRYYALPKILETGMHLYLDTETWFCVLVDGNTDPPTLVEAQVFTNIDILVLRPLLDNYPDYAPHTTIYAAHYGLGEHRAGQLLDDAEETHTWDSAMRGTRGVISRLRPRLRQFGIDIKCLMDTGYVLIRLRCRR